MMKIQPTALLTLLLTLFAGLLQSQAESAPPLTAEGFRVPHPDHPLSFPRDHGNHPDFKIEWWYLTGQFRTEDSAEFGYQATFFRFAGTANPAFAGTQAFGTDHLHLAHIALLDKRGGRFYQNSRLNRQGWQARSSTERLDLFNGDWRLVMHDAEEESMTLNLNYSDGPQLTLQLTPLKPKVIFGEEGVSRKGADPEATSYYISFTRLGTTGTLIWPDGRKEQVLGLSWMDHEIASRQLSADLAGWDWTAIHLYDGSEIKAYILRRPDGTPDSYSRWITIDANGQSREYGPEAFRWETLQTWSSPDSGGEYPIRLRLTGPAVGVDAAARMELTLEPLLEQQEILDKLGQTTYWEGACRVLDESGKEVGRAYLELVGYAGSVSEGLR